MAQPLPPPRPDRARLAVIAVGGALGTLARYGVNRLGPSDSLAFPWPTLVVNVTGSFILGVVVTLVVERWPPTRYVRPFAAIGFCGGFTTFSTLVVQTARLGQHDRLGLAALDLFGSMAIGLLAAVAGIGVVRGSSLRHGRRPIPDPDDIALLDDPPESSDKREGRS
jgi:fluoride exporter